MDKQDVIGIASLIGALTLTVLLICFVNVQMKKDIRRVYSAPLPQGCVVHVETDQWGWPEDRTVCK